MPEEDRPANERPGDTGGGGTAGPGGSPHPPSLRTIVLCDYVSVDASGKFSLHGVFAGIRVQAFPARHPRMFLFVQLSDMLGHYPLRVNCVHPNLETILPLVDQPKGVEAHDARQIINLRLELGNFPIPQAGTYELQVHLGGHLAGSIPFDVFGPGAEPGEPPVAPPGALPGDAPAP
jgi:hypothetical protein